MIKPLIIILLSTLAFSANVKVSVNNKIRVIQPTKISGTDYITASAVSKLLLPGSKFKAENNKIEAGDFDLYYFPKSFFVIKEDWAGSHYYQLGMPAVTRSGRDFLPLKTLVYALDTMDVFDVASAEKGVQFTLVSKGQTLLQPLASNNRTKKIRRNREGKYSFSDTYSLDPFRDSFLENNEKLKEAFKNLEPKLKKFETLFQEKTPSFISDEPKANSYGLPKGLIRRELDEVRKKE